MNVSAELQRLEAEHLGREQRQDGPLLADHPADQSVDRDEQRELAEVRPEAEPDAGQSRDVGIGGRHAPVARGRPTARDQSRALPRNTVRCPAGPFEEAGRCRRRARRART